MAPAYSIAGKSSTNARENHAYLKKYHPISQYGWSHDFEVQELSRILTAQLRRSTPHYKNGHVSMSILKVLYENNKQNLSAGFLKLLETSFAECENVTDETNVRETVRAIWMYPMKGYLPWNRMDSKTEQFIIDAVKECRKQQPWTMALHAVRGETVKIHVEGFFPTLWSIPGVAATLTAAIGFPVGMNFEPSHITLVNSGVLAKVDQKEFTAAFADEFKFVANVVNDIVVERVDHTVSLDYAPFLVSIVVRLKSDALSELIARINQKFKAHLKDPIKPSFHITIAVSLR